MAGLRGWDMGCDHALATTCRHGTLGNAAASVDSKSSASASAGSITRTTTCPTHTPRGRAPANPGRPGDPLALYALNHVRHSPLYASRPSQPYGPHPRTPLTYPHTQETLGALRERQAVTDEFRFKQAQQAAATNREFREQSSWWAPKEQLPGRHTAAGRLLLGLEPHIHRAPW